MISSYSKTSSIGQAVSDTFSGEHPCELCLKIEEAKKEDGKSGKNRPDSALVAKAVHDAAPATDLVVPRPIFVEAPMIVILPPLGADGICGARPLLQPPRA